MSAFRPFLSLASVLLALAIPCSIARAAEADTLAQAVFDRPVGRDVTTIGRMELTDKNGSRRVRQLVTYRQERGKSEFAALIRFLQPEDIAGTGFLTVDKADGANEQWLFLPALDRVRRVAGDRKGGRFVGSDIVYEDLQTRRPQSDKHRLVGKEALNGVACEVLESVPIDAASSIYSKRLSWIDPQTAMALRVDYFDKDPAAPSKRWLLVARKQIQGYWTVTDSRVTDLASGHETRLVVENAKYDRKLPARLFSSQALADESLESGYRP